MCIPGDTPRRGVKQQQVEQGRRDRLDCHGSVVRQQGLPLADEHAVVAPDWGMGDGGWGMPTPNLWKSSQHTQ